MAYSCFSAVCDNHFGLEDRREILFLSLEIGFRHDPTGTLAPTKFSPIQRCQWAAGVVFGSDDGEAVADLLFAWTLEGDSDRRYTFLKACQEQIIGLRNLPSFSPRLKRNILLGVRKIGLDMLAHSGTEFAELLDKLSICVEDLGETEDDKTYWATLILNVIRSAEGIRRLSCPYWELLAELSVSASSSLLASWSPTPMEFLKNDQELDKLEHWIGVTWVLWSEETQKVQGGIDEATLFLFHRRDSAIQKTRRLMERRSNNSAGMVEFLRVCAIARAGS